MNQLFFCFTDWSTQSSLFSNIYATEFSAIPNETVSYRLATNLLLIS